MPLLSAFNLTKSFGPDDIFTGISFSVPHRARIGLVGANGVGKTTLLRILVGQEEATNGSVQTARGARVGYLPQEAVLEGSHPLWEECLRPFAELVTRQAELAQLEHNLTDDNLEYYSKRQFEFDAWAATRMNCASAKPWWGLVSCQSIFTAPSRSFPAGSAPAQCWHDCCSANPTCCCWMSPPTTWTLKPWNGWKPG